MKDFTLKIKAGAVLLYNIFSNYESFIFIHARSYKWNIKLSYITEDDESNTKNVWMNRSSGIQIKANINHCYSYQIMFSPSWVAKWSV
jgi:hypothetical protein